LIADRRDAARHQGHHRDRRHADRARLAAVCRLPHRSRRRQRCGFARGGRGDPRESGDHRVRRHRTPRHPQSMGPGAHPGGGERGSAGVQGPAEPPPPRRPRALAVLQTSGWEEAASAARAAFEAAAARLAAAGIALADRHADPVIEDVEGAITDAAPLTRRINAWEGRWPLNTYRKRDASKLSRSALERLATAEAMTLADYGAAIALRQR